MFFLTFIILKNWRQIIRHFHDLYLKNFKVNWQILLSFFWFWFETFAGHFFLNFFFFWFWTESTEHFHKFNENNCSFPGFDLKPLHWKVWKQNRTVWCPNLKYCRLLEIEISEVKSNKNIINGTIWVQLTQPFPTIWEINFSFKNYQYYKYFSNFY